MAIKRGPSSHLYWSELACHDGTPYPIQWREDRAERLAANYESVRNLLGDIPLVILSGYRTPEWNKHVEGAAGSQHVQGRATDIWHPTRSPESMFDEIYSAQTHSRLPLLGGLGLYKTFVHIDVRPKVNNHLAIWFGKGIIPR